MTRALTLITMILAIAFGTAGGAAAGVTANTKWLNTSLLNGVTADLNMSNGGPSFYTWTGQPLPGVYLDGTTFVSSNGASGNDFIWTWTTAVIDGTLSDVASSDGTSHSETEGGAPSYTFIADRVHPSGAAAGTFLYRILFLAPDGAWQDLCPGGNNGPGWAIPLEGEWDYVTGARISYGGNKFTWACTTGALGKCAASGMPNTLGYEPWETDPYYQSIQASPGVWYWVMIDGKRMHQACTRMIRADYCGDGVFHTAVGNRIDVRDFLLNGQSLTMYTQWAAEALWDENGASWVSCDRSGHVWPGSGISSSTNSSIDSSMASNNDPPGKAVCQNNHHIENSCLGEFEMPSPQDGQILLGNLTANLAAAPTDQVKDQGGDLASP